ncbi:MAG: hypothetical protein MPW14_20705 [Candidatus Manganitrophus sp.]|nr:hypothetical protein [Candidatus Manganitrophus sp.]WDT72956.1 MAG: hypothetical protein MPW17_08995 [Candidatus Manganitrophus sp.]WDT74828.1 MAG: hypothetical protein MPW16_16380 [Candidatus Manganitrophus sp.]WDT79529.1 MAG: hypothetical protein MPW14_20705 [Candidatus Manganitrophus sp.]
MEIFEPYLAFRWIVALLFAGYLLYDLIELSAWYRALPRMVQRIVLLKLLQLRSRALKVELSLIVILFFVQGWLTILLLKG